MEQFRPNLLALSSNVDDASGPILLPAAVCMVTSDREDLRFDSFSGGVGGEGEADKGFLINKC